MKTIITIEIETDFKPIYSDPEREEEVTKDFEEEFHEAIEKEITDLLQGDEFEDKVFEHELEYAVEEYDSFNDYGEVSIKIKTAEIKEDKQ